MNDFLNNHKKLAIALAVLLSGLVNIGLASADTLSLSQQEKASINSTYTVGYGDIESTVEGKGFVQAGREVKVTAPVGVIVKEVLVKSGESVSAGQALANIDSASISAKLAEAVDTETQIQNQLDRGNLTDYERDALTGKRTSIRSYISTLRDLRDYPVITAPQNGVVNNIYLVDGYPVTVQNTMNSDSNASRSSSSTTGVSLFKSDSTTTFNLLSVINPISLVQFGLFLNSQPVRIEPLFKTTKKVDSVSLQTADISSDIIKISDNTSEGYSGESDEIMGSDDTYINGREGFIPDTSSSNADYGSLDGYSSSSSSESSGSNSSNSALSGIGDVSSYEALAFRIGSMDDLLVDIKVDERDILNVSPGQEATIKLEALPDEEFKGNISKVASAGTTGDGNTKYDVEVSLNTDKNLKSGMTANVTISTGNNQNVLVIPVNALQDLNGRKFVYTFESDDGTLGGEVDVTTGLSNKDYVEVTSGLQAGSVIYYEKADNTNSFTDDMTNVITEDETGEESGSE